MNKKIKDYEKQKIDEKSKNYVIKDVIRLGFQEDVETQFTDENEKKFFNATYCSSFMKPSLRSMLVSKTPPSLRLNRQRRDILYSSFYYSTTFKKISAKLCLYLTEQRTVKFSKTYTLQTTYGKIRIKLHAIRYFELSLT